MVEIPRLPSGNQHIVCGTCPAKIINDGEVYCDESKIYRRPKFCPLSAVVTKSGSDAYAMLREQLRHHKP